MKQFKFTIRGHDYEVEILQIEKGRAEIEVNGTRYNVDFEIKSDKPEPPKLVRKVIKNPEGAHEIKKSEDAHIFKVLAPLPGTILKILVKPGDKVNRGDKLLIMEAMKMENEILAEKPGIVQKIAVQEGMSVLQGDVLIELE